MKPRNSRKHEIGRDETTLAGSCRKTPRKTAPFYAVWLKYRISQEKCIRRSRNEVPASKPHIAATQRYNHHAQYIVQYLLSVVAIEAPAAFARTSEPRASPP